MVEMLEKAIAEVAKLSPEDQESFAYWMLEELADEARWTKTFSQSIDKLGEQVLADFRAGLVDEAATIAL